MKKFLSVLLMLIMIVPVSVSAEEFAFDIFDLKDRVNADEAVLMEVDDDVKAALEERLIAAWENMDSEVQLYPDIKIHKDDIVSYFSLVYFENPQYYYVARSFSGKSNGGYMTQLTNLRYTVESMDEVKATWAEIDKATEEILFYLDSDMTDFEKIMTVHDYMVNNYAYDITDADQTYLVMLDKKGVCAAYAEAFQYMMNVIGIESTLVTSDEMGHIWNMVKLDNRWYHVDITWDDPNPNQEARISHEYMFLSTKAIEEKGHTGFTAPYSAISTVYNKADWRDDGGALVTINGILYRVEGNNLIDENSTVIYKNLDGGDGKWSVSGTSYVKDVVWTGLCEINGILYFNTDKGIYSYDPITKATECVWEEYGIGGLYADKNKIVYSIYDFDNSVFVEKGEIEICQSFVKSAAFEDGKAVVKYYNDLDNPVWVISKGESCKIHKIDPKSVGVAQFDNGDNQEVFIWEQSLTPATEKIELSK